MNLPPVDLSLLNERFRELANQVLEASETSRQTIDDMDEPVMLREAMSQLIEMLNHLSAGDDPQVARAAEINTLCEYGLHLIEELSALAGRLEQQALASEIERLSLPCALWFARQGAEIRNLAPVVNALAFLANQSADPRTMARLYTHCCEVVEATSPACEDSDANDPRQPWRMLLLNRAIVATRSHNPELIEPAFDAIVDYLPQEAAQFFAEGMEQMAIMDYPAQVRELVQRYFSTCASPRRLH